VTQAVRKACARSTGANSTPGRAPMRGATLFRRLVAARHFLRTCCGEIDTFARFPTAFKMNIRAHEPPRYRAFDAARSSSGTRRTCTSRRVSIIGARIRRCQVRLYSSRPFLTAVVPTIVDDSLPLQQARHQCLWRHAPIRWRDNATWADEKRNLTKAALDVLDEDGARVFRTGHRYRDARRADLEAIVGLPQAISSRRTLGRSAVSGSVLRPIGRTIALHNRALPVRLVLTPGAGSQAFRTQRGARDSQGLEAA